MLSPGEFENRPAVNRIGIYLLMLCVAGVCLAAIIYLTQMGLLGWSTSSTYTTPSRSLTARVQLVLYRSESTARFLASVGGNVEALLTPWRNYAKQNSVALTELSSLEGLKPADGRVLVLASALALDEAERDAVFRYKSGGGSVLTTWATGSRDGAGQWVGWPFLESLVGLSVVGELPPDGSAHFMVTRGQGPITHGLAAGTRIGLGKVAERSILFKGAQLAAEASTSDLGGSARVGLLVFQEFGSDAGGAPSRVAAWGIPETAWEYQPADVHTLLSGTLGWLARQSVVVTSNWPDAQRAAHVVALEAQDGLPAALALADQLQLTTQPVSLYVSSEMAKTHSAELQRRRGQLDVGYQGDSLQGFGGQSEAAQATRVRRMVDDMAAALTTPGVLAGFDAPGNSLDAVTDKLLYDAGVRYRLGADADAAQRLPFFQAVPGERSGERFVVLPHNGPDSPQRVSAAQGDADRLLATLKTDFTAARDRGELGLLVLRADDAAPDSPWPKVLPQLATHWAAQSGGVWFATGTEVAHWWNDKERFQIGVRPAGARLEVDVSVLGQGDFEHGALVVMVPRKGVLPEVRGLKTGMPVPRVELLDDFRAVIRFDRLPVGNYSYQLTF